MSWVGHSARTHPIPPVQTTSGESMGTDPSVTEVSGMAVAVKEAIAENEEAVVPDTALTRA